MTRILLILILVSSVLGVQISVIRESDDQIDLQVVLPEPTMAQLNAEDELISYPRLSGTRTVYDAEKKQLLPLVTVPILLPPDGSLPQITIINSQFTSVQEPGTRFTLAETNPIYEELDDYPADDLVIAVSGEAFSGINTGQVIISPFAQEGQRLTTIQLSLKFSSRSRSGIQSVRPDLLDHYINADMAGSWGKTSKVRLAKSAEQLPTGEWFKIPIGQTGIYRINSISFSGGVPSSDPRSWRVYAPKWEGQALPKVLEIGATPDNLKQISTQGTGLDDGAMSGDDQIIFFAHALNSDFRGDNFTHHYDTERYYWLCIPDDGTASTQLVSALANSAASVTDIVQSYQKRFYHEAEITNQLHSGENWVGEKLNSPGDYLNFAIVDDQLDRDAEIDLDAHFVYDFLGYTREVSFDVTLNSLPFSTTGKRYSLTKSHLERGTASGTMMQNGTNVLRLTYRPSDSEMIMYLDSLRLAYHRYLAPHDDFMLGTVDLPGAVNQLNFRNLSPDFKVWDISDPTNVEEWGLTNDSFVREGQTKREIIGFSLSQVMQTTLEAATDLGTPVLRSPNHHADYIIITPEIFMDEAERMQDLRENLAPVEERMTVKIATLKQIYDEFSAGTADPGAIKHFLHYAYFSWQDPNPGYVLLLGDTDYDYRNISGLSKMMVPSIQIDATSELRTYSCDDRFTYLESGLTDEQPDISIGRLPAQTGDELSAMVDKIVAYVTNPEPGHWRNTITLVADDPLRPSTYVETEHILDSEFIEYIVPEGLYVDKLYLTEYPEEQDPNSPYVKKPQARDALLKKLNNGTLLVNYLGHGSPNVWAQENVFTSSDLGQVKTDLRLPFWVAGTCDWAKYDDVGVSCQPEELMRMKDNGAVGILSATRKTYATYNIIALSHFFQALFPDDKGSRSIPVGDAIRVAKNQYGTNITNNEKYVLLSDPALKLASPERKGKITSINPAELRAMSQIDFTGVTDTSLSEQAQASVTVYDTPSPVTRTFTYNGGQTTGSISYILPGKRIFRGLISVDDSVFSGSFTLPKDIKYSGEGGILNVQYWDDTGLDGNIYLDTLEFRGSDSTALNEEGPSILFLSDNMVLLNGDNFSANEALQVEISDPQGINLTGSAGHGISLAIDGEWENALDLTELFEYDLDKSDIGQLSVYLSDIQPGEHLISIKAWDTQNNPNESEIRLTFFAAADFRAYDLFNFPNPMSDNTEITYMLSHDADVSISIYTLAGRKVYSEDVGYQSQGFNSMPWDGRDTFGNLLANGVYIIVLEASSDEFEEPSQVLQKAVITR